MKTIDYRNLELLPKLPHYFRPHDGEEIPSDLVGATIIRIGTPAEAGLIEGGGLVIDYRPEGSTEVRRVVFGFNELAMWVASNAR
jgi:hypothetical protein